MAAADRYFHLIDTDTSLPEKPDAVALTEFKDKIELDRAEFSYDERKIIDGVSFAIPKGHMVAVVGETGSGQGLRWDNQTASDILHKLANTDPNSDEAYDLHVQFLQEAVKDMPFINVTNGTKFVPTNSTYWEGYPNSENNYNGPWWWWSCFKYMLPNITPVQG